MSGAGSSGFGRPAAAAAAGLWQAGGAGFITPVGGLGIQIPTSVQLAEQVAAPAAVANTGHVYTLDVGGVTELHYVDSAGAITQITGGGTLFHSLQDAYDDGTIITTTGPLGSVIINNAQADASSCLELTRTLAIGGYALEVNPVMAIIDAGGVNLSTFTMNGTDLEVTNATALGDMAFASTVEMRFSVAGGQELSINTNAILVTTATQLQFGVVGKNISENGGHLDINSNARIDLTATSGIRMYGPGYAAILQTAGLTMQGVAYVAFGAASRQIVANGADLEITNTTALGDIIYNATVLHSYEIAGTPEYEMSATAFTALGGNMIQWNDSTNNDITTSWQMPALTTPAAAITTMETITLSDNHSYTIIVEAVAMEGDGSDRRGFIKSGVFYRDGAGALQQGVTISTMNEGSAAVLLDFTVNGNDVRVSVTGIAAETWRWTGKITVVELD